LLQSLQQDKKMWSALLKQTLDRIEAEKKARKNAGLPPGFVPDILNSIEYSSGQALEHISAVSRQHYASRELREPVINFLCLTESGAGPSRRLSRDLMGLARPYEGSITFFNAPGAAW
jgi:hypothetical protein